MTFYALGLNHETAPLPVRERYALGAEQCGRFLTRLSLSDDAEIIVLSTCNRTEAYLFGRESDTIEVKRALAAAAGEDWSDESAFTLADESAVRHVLHVASGMKSMVVGDVQILAQMKEAYRIAVEAERVGTVMHRLMHTAFRSAKRVLSSTGVGSGAASISSAAVALARPYFGGSLQGRSVLLVGAGEVGNLVLQALRTAKPDRIVVVNRSRERAAALRAGFPAVVADWEDRYELMRAADLVVVATSAEHHVIRADEAPARPTDAAKALVLDLGVPRNVDPVLESVAGYRVLDMDALEDWTRRVEEARRLELPKADEIVQEELAEFVTWMFHQQALQPAIQTVRDTFEFIRRQEIERHHRRFSDVDREELDQLTRSIMQKLLAVPIVRLKSSDPESVDLVRGVELLRSFFSLDNCEASGAPESDATEAGAEKQPPAVIETPLAIPSAAARSIQA